MIDPINLPQDFGLSLGLDCVFDDVNAEVIPLFPGVLGFELVAVPYPPDPQAPPGPVSAAYSIAGDFVLHLNDARPADWLVCLTGGPVGTGTGYASGSFGPFTFGEPCDFAHAMPIPSNDSFNFAVNMSGRAVGNEVVSVGPGIEFFDARGNEVAPIGFSLSALPGAGVPEPSTIIPAALALMGLRLMRRRL